MNQHNFTTYILSWDIYGLESCINATELDMQHIVDLLLDPKLTRTPALNSIMTHILMRAKANPQRHYEVYSVQVESCITEYDLKLQFEECPQDMANLIRARGNKIYSDRRSKRNIKIH